jgi:hypothetical protein
MTAQFRISGLTITREATGSNFRVSGVPLEFSEFNCFYANPVYALKVGFLAIFVNEVYALEQRQYGRVIEQLVCTGVILERGRLKAALEQKFKSSVPGFIINDLIADVYELIVHWLNTDLTRYYHFNNSEVPVHIYEAEPRPFNDAMWNIACQRKARPRNNFKIGSNARFFESGLNKQERALHGLISGEISVQPLWPIVLWRLHHRRRR